MQERARKTKYKTPPKQKGVAHGAFLNIYVDPEFRATLKEFAARQSTMSGIKVSMGNVIQTALLQRYPDMRDRYKQLKKEKSNERKYLDGIKG